MDRTERTRNGESISSAEKISAMTGKALSNLKGPAIMINGGPIRPKTSNFRETSKMRIKSGNIHN
jgi:hypothetical protein